MFKQNRLVNISVLEYKRKFGTAPRQIDLKTSQQPEVTTPKPTPKPTIQDQLMKDYPGIEKIDPKIANKSITVDPVTKNATYTPPVEPEKPKMPANVFQNKATGLYYNAQGQEVDATGKIISTGNEAEKDLLTPENLISGKMQETADIAQKYGLTEGATTIDEVVKKYKEDQASETAYQEKQLAAQEKLDQADLDRMIAQGKTGISGMTAAMAQSREGAMGTSAPLAASEYKTEMGKRFDEAQTRFQMAQDQRDKLKQDLKKAQESGDQDLAQQIQGQIASAEMEILQAKNDNLSLLAQANEDTRAAEASARANLESFVGIVNSGTTMTMDGLATMANTLNIPLETAYDYYNGAQTIRDDKTLDNQTKQIQLDQLSLDLENSIKGINTTQAQNSEYIANLYKSGATPEAISAAKQIMGISDENDPMYQAELKYNTAQAAIAQYEADHMGEPPPAGTLDRINYDIKKLELQQAQMEMNELYGITDISSVPQETLKDLFALPGGSRITSSFAEGHKQCGEAFNDLTDGPNVGNGYYTGTNNKMSFVDGNITSPQVGNGLVIPYGGTTNGHIETVIGNSNGIITTVSYNRDGKGTETIETYTMDDLNKFGTLGENWGFINSTLRPEYENQLNNMVKPAETGYNENSAEGELMSKWEKQATNLGLTGDRKEAFLDKQISASYGKMTESESSAFNAYSLAYPEHEGYNELWEGVDPEEFADSMNYVTKQITKVGEDVELTPEIINRVLDGVDDVPTRRALMAQMTWVQAVLRKESGAAISLGEYMSKGTAFFPSAGDDAQTIQDKADRRENQMIGLYGQMGPAGQRTYEEIAFNKKNEKTPEQIELDEIWNAPDPIASSGFNMDQVTSWMNDY